jgi:2',3'-cyclic-nucleotide 2'-phosphodiesterase (5'-nucleotidase family)
MRDKILAVWMSWMIAIAAYGQKGEVHILAVNDMHAAIEAFPQLTAIADSLRTLYPSLLVFSAGDNRTGNPISDMYRVS